jgi:hypothetical protein
MIGGIFVPKSQHLTDASKLAVAGQALGMRAPFQRAASMTWEQDDENRRP